MHGPCHRQQRHLPPGPYTPAQATGEHGNERWWLSMRIREEAALGGARIALPALDERAVLRSDRGRRTAALHRVFRLGHPRVHVGEVPVRVVDLRLEDGTVTRELTVLEHDRLVCLIEHRRQLEVARELPGDRVRGSAETLAGRGVAAAEEAIDDAHDAMLACIRVCMCRMRLMH